jgi:hypothetical protein
LTVPGRNEASEKSPATTTAAAATESSVMAVAAAASTRFEFQDPGRYERGKHSARSSFPSYDVVNPVL